MQSQNFSYALGYYDEGANRDYIPINNTAGASGNTLIVAQETSLYNGNISTMRTKTPAFARNVDDNNQPLVAEFTKQFTYDQLNRIKTSKVENNGLPSGIPGAPAGTLPAGAFSTTYDYDANGNITNLTRRDASGSLYDEMVYNYHNVDEGYLRNTNRLRWVDDNESTEDVYEGDIEDQDRNNYDYDEIGNLINDVTEDIERIEWTAAGKVHAVIRKAGSNKANLYFSYDAMGNRVAKKSIPENDPSNVTTTYYFREASGNVMSVYKRDQASFTPREYHIYGSDRMGMLTLEAEDALAPSVISTIGEISFGSNELGRKQYELKDHLGNVHLVLSDRIETTTFDNAIAGYEYYPFGMALQTYENEASLYRYGFNGMEKDDDWNGAGNALSTHFRQYDPRLGKWMSLDPKMTKYPWLSPFAAFNDNPVYWPDPFGDDPPKITGDEVAGQEHVDDEGQNYVFESEKTDENGELVSDAQWVQKTFAKYSAQLYIVRGTNHHGGGDHDKHKGHVIFYYSKKIVDADGKQVSQSIHSDRVDLHPGKAVKSKMGDWLSKQFKGLSPRYWKSEGIVIYDQPSVLKYIAGETDGYHRGQSSRAGGKPYGNNAYSYKINFDGKTYDKLSKNVKKWQTKKVHYGLIRKRCASYAANILHQSGVIKYHGFWKRRHVEFSPGTFKDFMDKYYEDTYDESDSYTKGKYGL